MNNNEKKLHEGAKAFKLLGKLRKYAEECLGKGDYKYDAALVNIAALENLFKPYHIGLEQIKEEKRQREIEIKAKCASEGHVGDWIEEKYVKDVIIDRERTKMDFIRWSRICTRCGEKEVTEDMPEEVKRERKRARIREMEAEIRKMKAELNE